MGALRVHGGGDPAAAALRAAGGRLQPPHRHRRHRPRRHQQGRQQRGLVHHVGPVHRGSYLDNIGKAGKLSSIYYRVYRFYLARYSRHLCAALELLSPRQWPLLSQ